MVLVENDPALLRALSFAFETEGYRVRAHLDGRSALAALPIEQGACVVIDQRLSDCTGLDLLTRLRGRGVCAAAILITSNPSTEIRAIAAAAGAEIVEKPLLGDALASKVRQALA